DFLTKDALAAIDIIKTERPELRLRFVNIMTLSSNGLGEAGSCLTNGEFHEIFTNDQPVICNFHGYPETLKSIIYNYSEHPKRFAIHGYCENGSTTTPFDMHVRNKTSRYDLAIDAFERARDLGLISYEDAESLAIKYRNKIDENVFYIKQNGVDLPEIDVWQWNR
ncbi:MAG: phosphoketolase family protein, partial [Candidatus Saccharibacteria bacterium]